MFHGKMHDEDDDELPRYEEEEGEGEGLGHPHDEIIEEVEEIIVEEEPEEEAETPAAPASRKPAPRRAPPARKAKKSKKARPKKTVVTPTTTTVPKVTVAPPLGAVGEQVALKTKSNGSISLASLLIVLGLSFSIACFAVAAVPVTFWKWRPAAIFAAERQVDLTLVGIALLVGTAFTLLLAKGL